MDFGHQVHIVIDVENLFGYLLVASTKVYTMTDIRAMQCIHHLYRSAFDMNFLQWEEKKHWNIFKEIDECREML